MQNKKTYNSQVIIFAGAGASAALGMPTTLQFIELLKQHWANINPLLETYRKAKSSDGPTKRQPMIDSEYLRDWLLELRTSAESIQAISKYELFKTNVPKTQDAVKLMDAILVDFDSFTRSCYIDVNSTVAYQHYLPLLEGLRSNNIDTVPLFTTNYDLIFESMQDCAECKWHIETGMRKTGRHVILDTNLYDQVTTNLAKLLIYKLHGSTDWWMNKDTNEIHQIPLDHKASENYRDLMIYPTRSKFEKVHEMPYSFFYKEFDNQLLSEKLSLCIAIGYSFRDLAINETFAVALRNGLRLLIFDKNININQLMNEFSSSGLNHSLMENNIHIFNRDFGNWQGNPKNRTVFSNILKEELSKALTRTWQTSKKLY